jgi:hypothetical protein
MNSGKRDGVTTSENCGQSCSLADEVGQSQGSRIAGPNAYQYIDWNVVK